MIEKNQAKKEALKKSNRELPEIADLYWNAVNTFRENHKCSWNEFFQRMANYADTLEMIFRMPLEPTEVAQIDAKTCVHLMPMWLDFMYQNFLEKTVKAIPDIKILKNKYPNVPAVVIASGPSVAKYNHLEMLAESEFYRKKMGIISTNAHSLKDCLEAGVVPDYISIVDAEKPIYDYINYDIIDKYVDNITLVAAMHLHPDVMKRWKGNKRIYFLMGVSDATIPNVAAVLAGLFPNMTEFNAMGNVGSFSWNITRYMGCSPIALIGFDFSFLKDTPIKETPYYHDLLNSGFETEKEMIDQCYSWHKHSFFGTECYADFIYRSFRETLREAILHAEKEEGIHTINCTGGGLVDFPGLECMYFEDFLAKFNNAKPYYFGGLKKWR